MNYLGRVIQQLTENEIAHLRNLYAANSSNFTTQKKLSILHYHEKQSLTKKPVFNQFAPYEWQGKLLVEDLMVDICRSIVFGGEGLDKYSYIKQELKCKQLITLIELLLQKEFYQEAGFFLQRAMQIAKNSELFNEQLILNQNYNYNSLFYGNAKLKVQIDSNTIVLLDKTVTKCKVLNNEIRAAFYLGKCFTKPQITNWENRLLAIAEIAERYKSHRLKYYSACMLAFLVLQIGDGETGIKICNSIILQLNKIKIFNNEKILLHVQTLQAFFYLKNNNKPMATAMFDEIKLNEMECYLKEDLCSLEYLFRLALASTNLKKANFILDLSKTSFIVSANNYLKFKWSVFKVVFLMHQKQFTDAYQLITKIEFCYKKRTPLEMYLNVVELMCAYHSKNLGLILINTETWKKLLYRNCKTFSKTEPRLAAILHICKSLVVSQFNFAHTLKKENDLMQKLSEGKGKFKFMHSGFELMRFDEWMSREGAK